MTTMVEPTRHEALISTISMDYLAQMMQSNQLSDSLSTFWHPEPRSKRATKKDGLPARSRRNGLVPGEATGV